MHALRALPCPRSVAQGASLTRRGPPWQTGDGVLADGVLADGVRADGVRADGVLAGCVPIVPAQVWSGAESLSPFSATTVTAGLETFR